MNNKNDKQLFNQIFRDLRKQGFIARQNYKCCQLHGWDAMVSEYGVNSESNVVFYDIQDYDAFNNDNILTKTIYLSWQGDGDKIVEVIKKYGYKVDWSRSENMRIGVIPKN